MADWTANDPTIVTDPAPNLTFEEAGPGQSSIRVRVEFTAAGESPRQKDYVVAGADARADLAKLVHRDQQTLQGFDGMTTGAVTPVNPSPVDQAIDDYQLAVRRKQALNELIALMGLTGTDTVGVSSITVDQVTSNLDTSINENIDSQANIERALDNYRR